MPGTKKDTFFFDASGKFDIKQGIHKIFMSSEMLDTVSSKSSEKCLNIDLGRGVANSLQPLKASKPLSL